MSSKSETNFNLRISNKANDIPLETGIMFPKGRRTGNLDRKVSTDLKETIQTNENKEKEQDNVQIENKCQVYVPVSANRSSSNTSSRIVNKNKLSAQDFGSIPSRSILNKEVISNNNDFTEKANSSRNNKNEVIRNISELNVGNEKENDIQTDDNLSIQTDVSKTPLMSDSLLKNRISKSIYTKFNKRNSSENLTKKNQNNMSFEPQKAQKDNHINTQQYQTLENSNDIIDKLDDNNSLNRLKTEPHNFPDYFNKKLSNSKGISFIKSNLFTRNNATVGDGSIKPISKLDKAKFLSKLTSNQIPAIEKFKKNISQHDTPLKATNTLLSNYHSVGNSKINDEIFTPTKSNFFEDENGNKNENFSYINIEDLILFEEKLSKIFNILDSKSKLIQNSCLDWWNFSNFSSIGGKLEHYFKDNASKLIVKETNLLELITIVICYDLSFLQEKFTIHLENFKNLFILIHQNFLCICDCLVSKVTYESRDNMWVNKLSQLISNKFIKSLNINNVLILVKNNDTIRKLVNRIFTLSFEEELIKSIEPYLDKLNSVTLNDINEIFKKKSLRIENKNASIPAYALDIQKLKNDCSVPLIKTKPTHEFTLILDLDETLIHFQLNGEDEDKGILSIRPGLFQFLDILSEFYEIMIFTAGTEEYADPILDAIETYKKYFSERFYRRHTSIVNNDFVKDISRIGRDLSKMIIVDNSPQNFRLQKENGIFIKTFYGEDNEDVALINLLPILHEIAINHEKDVRKALLRYKDEIMKKVTSNISK